MSPREFYYAVNQGAQVINLSLGTDQPSRTLFESVLYAEFSGTVVVASAGNNGMNCLHYPASYPGVIDVAALEPGDLLASFSNFALPSSRMRRATASRAPITTVVMRPGREPRSRRLLPPARRR